MGFAFKHWKKIVAVIIVVLLIITALVQEREDAACGPDGSSSASGGGAGPVTAEGLAYPTVEEETTFTSGYGMRGGEMHKGVDLAGELGTPIYAFADGEVIAAADQGVGGFGGWVVMSHEIEGREMSTVYGHQDPGGVSVEVGQTVKAGDEISRIGNSGGSTGPHLHFEIYEGNRLEGGQDLDPAPWVEKAKGGTPQDDSDEDKDDEERSRDEDDEDSDDADDSSSTDSGEAPTEPQAIRELRAQQIIDGGKQRDADENTIVAAISAAMVESDLHNLASEAVPESKTYPNDGVAPGDYDSVNLFQMRVSIWGDSNGGVEGLMNIETQVGWFYDQAEGMTGSPGEIAANVENPAAEYRGKYADVQDIAQEYYDVLEEGAEGTLGEIGSGNQVACGSGSSPGADGGAEDADGLGAAILAAARKQFGQDYVWGGGDHNGPTGGGFDCSGLTMYAVYQATNGKVALDHQTNAQAADPNVKEVDWKDAEPGDLLLFGDGGSFHHVSIYSGESDGKKQQYEAQTEGVPVGEYPISSEPSKVVRVVLPDSADDDKDSEEEKDAKDELEEAKNDGVD